MISLHELKQTGHANDAAGASAPRPREPADERVVRPAWRVIDATCHSRTGLEALQPLALDRFCQRVLAEVGRLAGDADKSNHQRYLAVFRLLQRRDEELANAFN